MKTPAGRTPESALARLGVPPRVKHFDDYNWTAHGSIDGPDTGSHDGRDRLALPRRSGPPRSPNVTLFKPRRAALDGERVRRGGLARLILQVAATSISSDLGFQSGREPLQQPRQKSPKRFHGRDLQPLAEAIPDFCRTRSKPEPAASLGRRSRSA